MKKGKLYIIQVPDGRKVKAEFIGTENDNYVLKFESYYSRNKKKISRMKFESGFACMEGTDYVILEEVK